MLHPTITKFFRESFNRLKTRSPRFFFILTMIGAALTLAGYIPAAIDRWTTISVSQQFINFCEDVGNWSKGFMLATLFAAESKPTGVTQDGSVIKKLDQDRYPFTSAVENKKAIDAETPVIKDPMPGESS